MRIVVVIKKDGTVRDSDGTEYIEAEVYTDIVEE